MSESNAIPTPDSSATPSASEGTSVANTQAAEGPVSEARKVPDETRAGAPEGKRKRKRKRRRKGAANPAPSAASGETASDNTTTPGAATPTSGGASVRPGAAPSTGSKRKRRGEAGRKHRRDGERPLRTQEQLASWRWYPNGAQLAYFPAAAELPTVESPASAGSPDLVASEQPPAPEVSQPEQSRGDANQDDANQDDAAIVSPEQLGATASVSDAPLDSPSGEQDATSPSLDGWAEPAPEAAANEGAEPLAAAVTTGYNTALAATSTPRWTVPQGPQLDAWLAVALERAPEAERASLVVSLCSHRAFRQRAPQLTSNHQDLLRSLAAVYDAIFLDTAPTVPSTDNASDTTQAPVDAREELRRGLEAVCTGSVDILRGWPLSARERLSELADDFELDNALYTDAPRLFFDAPKLLGRLGLRAICDALSRGQDATARELIQTVGSQPGVPGLLPMLTEALNGQRFGSLVILSYGGAQSRGPDPKAPKRHSGFCLESQRDVWIRTGESQDASAFEHYSLVHRRALLPGVVGLYAFGVTRSRKPYAAVLRKGISLQRRVGHNWGLQRSAAVGLCTELTLLASGLCRAGLRLPDLDPRRFELDEDGKLWVSDLWGAELMEPRAQDAQAVSICRDSVVQLLAHQPGFLLPADWREVLAHSADFETIVATLRKLEKSRFWSH